MLRGNVFVTGGTGTLGKAIARRVVREGWDCTLTIFSRDPVKQQHMRREYPGLRYILGDVCDARLLRAAIAGHQTVLHLAAQKHIPQGEADPEHCYAVNVDGSRNVLHAAADAGAEQIVFISTDKACWPINVYGCTKMMAERMYQQAARVLPLAVNIMRYGNVIGSTGSVVQVWREALARGETPTITDPTMTRFWLTVDQAVDAILYALDEPSGTITIPRLPALSMARLAEYVLPEGLEPRVVGLRPGEKMHEMLLTPQETAYCYPPDDRGYMRLHPVTGAGEYMQSIVGYTSDRAHQLERAELLAMLEYSSAESPLARPGVTLTEEQQQAIRELYDAGKLAQAQAVVIEGIRKSQ